MSLRAYLNRFPNSTRVRLVGPFCEPGKNLSEPIVFVDRGATCRRAEEGFSVGDGDSHAGHLDQRLKPDKDYSDLAYVLSELPQRVQRVELLGFLGGRLDHELFNLGEVHLFLHQRQQPAKVYFDCQIVAFSRGNWNFELHGLFSLAAIAPARVRLDGDCQYLLLQAQTLQPLSSRGLSNHAWGLVTLECDAPIFLLHHESSIKTDLDSSGLNGSPVQSETE